MCHPNVYRSLQCGGQGTCAVPTPVLSLCIFWKSEGHYILGHWIGRVGMIFGKTGLFFGAVMVGGVII